MLVFILTILSSIYAQTTIVTGEYLPFINPKAQDLGPHSLIVKEVFQDLKWKFEPKFFPWKRVQKMIQNNEATFSYSWFKNKERENDFVYSSEPIEEIPIYIYFNKLKLTDLNRKPDLGDFKNYRSSVIAGYWQEEVFKKEGIKYIVTPTLESNFALLADGRVDFVISSKLSADEALLKMDKNKIDVISRMSIPYKIDQLFFVASRKNANAKKFIDEWDNALRKYKKLKIL